MKIPRWGRNMNDRAVIGLVLSVMIAAATFTLSIAAPLPPRRVINHQARQCAEIIPGDECGDVVLPPGWEYIDVECPQEYAVVDLRPEWVPFKVSFCCTEGHSGVSGDCDDVVVNPLTRQCAFVEDIQKCSQLPLGWQTWGKDCSSGSNWTDDIACAGGAGEQIATATLLPPTDLPGVDRSTNTPVPTEVMPAQSTEASKSPFPTGVCCSLGMILASIALLYWRGSSWRPYP